MVCYCRIFTVGVVLFETDLCLAHGRANPTRQEFLHHTLSEGMGFVATGFGGGDFSVHTGEDGDDGGGLEQQRAEAAGGVMDGLGGVHVSAQFITAFPEGGVAFGFLEGHGVEVYLR